MSLKNHLKNKLDNKWIAGGILEDFARDLGYKSSNASRRLRELAHDGEIESKIERGFVWYRKKQSTKFYDIRPAKTSIDKDKMYKLFN